MISTKDEILIASWPRVIHSIHGPNLFIVTLSYSLYHDLESLISSMTQSHSWHPKPWVIHRDPNSLISSWPRVIHGIPSPKLFIVTRSHSFHHDPKSFMAFRALSSLPKVICILHIPEMFRSHHSSHLQVALTRHHEPESILISYPFRALSSWPRIVLFIYDPESFLAFKALSSRPRVVLIIYD